MTYEGMIAETVLINGHNGDQIDAYLARPLGAGPFPTVVLIHHMPGWDEASKEMARKLAYNGFATISPNLHFREGKATPQDNSTSVRDAGGMPDDRTMGDVQASINYLRSLSYSNGKVGIIGFCSGGRYTLMFACTSSNVNAAVDSAGGHIIPDELTVARPVAVIDMVANLSCPLLALFGEEDGNPSPAHATRLREELDKHGKSYEFKMYANAGHAFFADYRPSYRAAPAQDMWHRVLLFYEKYLKS